MAEGYLNESCAGRAACLEDMLAEYRGLGAVVRLSYRQEYVNSGRFARRRKEAVSWLRLRNETCDKNYKGRGVFDLCLKMEDGETLGFGGRTAQTTTIRQLMYFIRPDSGHRAAVRAGSLCLCGSTGALGYLPGEGRPSRLT